MNCLIVPTIALDVSLLERMAFNEDYLLRKWGSVGDIPFFKTPFNNPANKINEWKLETQNRILREAICAEFWNQENPSLYE